MAIQLQGQTASLWLSWRLVLFALVAATGALWSYGRTGVVQRWTQWDVFAYVRLARLGYNGYERQFHDGWVQAAFFPGEPLLLRAVHAVLPYWSLAALATGVVAGAVAVVLLTKLAALEVDDVVATWTARSFIVAPYVVFLAIGYAEAPFLALALGSWLAARRGNWWFSGLLAGLAATFRITGLFLGIALVVQYLVTQRRVRRDIIALALPFAVVVGYFTYLHGLTGRWDAWFHAQSLGWDRHLTLPWTALINTTHVIHGSTSARSVAAAVDTVFIIVGAACSVVLARRRMFGEMTYVALTVVALATSTTYYSVARAALLWWPLWIIVGNYCARSLRFRVAYFASAVPVTVVTTLAFTHGIWVD